MSTYIATYIKTRSYLCLWWLLTSTMRGPAPSTKDYILYDQPYHFCSIYYPLTPLARPMHVDNRCSSVPVGSSTPRVARRPHLLFVSRWIDRLRLSFYMSLVHHPLPLLTFVLQDY